MRGSSGRRRSEPSDLSVAMSLRARAARGCAIVDGASEICVSRSPPYRRCFSSREPLGLRPSRTRPSLARRRREGLHLTPLELEAAAAVFTFVAAVYAVRTYYARIREWRSDEASVNPFEQARAAKAALAELSAFQSRHCRHRQRARAAARTPAEQQDIGTSRDSVASRRFRRRCPS